MRGPVTALGDDGEEIEIAPDEDGPLVAYVFKTLADPYAGRLNLFRVFSGVIKGDSQVTNVTRRAKERIGQILIPGGKEHEQTDELGAGDIGAIAKLKETRAGDVLAEKDSKISFPPLDLPAPVMAFAFEPKTKGDEDKAASAIRRLEEEDPTLDVHRDQQTGEQIIAGLTQIHVEVIVDRMKDRFEPRSSCTRRGCPTSRRFASRQGARPLQEADWRTRPVRRLPPRDRARRGRQRYEFIDEIRAAPSRGIHPRGEKGVAEAMQHGTLAGYPVRTCRSVSTTASTTGWTLGERFKVAGSMAFGRHGAGRPRAARADHAAHGQRSRGRGRRRRRGSQLRRGRPLGMEAKGSATEIKAEVPMAEVLDYARDLRQITGGRGDYTMEFTRHEEIPSHLAQKVISEARSEEEVRA
jgi:elongation factor G